MSSCPLHVTPASSRIASVFSSVDLPLPEGPMMAYRPDVILPEQRSGEARRAVGVGRRRLGWVCLFWGWGVRAQMVQSAARYQGRHVWVWGGWVDEEAGGHAPPGGARVLRAKPKPWVRRPHGALVPLLLLPCRLLQLTAISPP